MTANKVAGSKIEMAHGAGGELMNRLIAESILKNLTGEKLGEVGLADLDDGASISLGDKEIVVSTDSYTISPIFFPGGNIGKLAACGTINDISVMGAKPIALASAIILEELSFPILHLYTGSSKISRSMFS